MRQIKFNSVRPEMPKPRRFPPLWSVKDIGAAFVAKDSGGQKLACVYYEEEPGRRIAAHLCLQVPFLHLFGLWPNRTIQTASRIADHSPRVLVSQGTNMADAIRQIGVSGVTVYRWRQEFGGLKIEQMKAIEGS